MPVGRKSTLPSFGGPQIGFELKRIEERVPNDVQAMPEMTATITRAKDPPPQTKRIYDRIEASE